MTPRELYQMYRNLSVDLHDGITVQVDIHKYRINGSANPAHATTDGLTAYGDLKEKIVHYYDSEKTDGFVLRRKPKSNYVLELPENGAKYCPLFPKLERVRLSPDLKGVFMGKGSPEEIRQALRLAVFFNLTDNAHLQNYCDANVGLDCSGFAGNVYGFDADKRLNQANAQYYLDHGTEVTRLESIRAGDAIVWADGGHIVVIDRVYPATTCLTKGDPVLQCMAAESTGSQMLPGGPADGLYYTEYSFLPPSQAPFKILRHKTNPNPNFYSPEIAIVRVS